MDAEIGKSLLRLHDWKALAVGTPLPQDEMSMQPDFEADSLFHEIFERSPDAVFLLNERGQFVYANPACAALLQVDVSVFGAGMEDEGLRDLAPPSEAWAGRTVSAT